MVSSLLCMWFAELVVASVNPPRVRKSWFSYIKMTFSSPLSSCDQGPMSHFMLLCERREGNCLKCVICRQFLRYMPVRIYRPVLGKGRMWYALRNSKHGVNYTTLTDKLKRCCLKMREHFQKGLSILSANLCGVCFYMAVIFSNQTSLLPIR